MNEVFLLSDIIPPNDFQSFLLWGIGGLISVVVLMWRLYISQLKKIEEMYIKQESDKEVTFKDRLDYKEKIISDLKLEIKDLQKSKERMISEIKPSMDASNSIASNVLEILRNGS